MTRTSSSQRLVLTGHAVDEEVRQESIFGIGVPAEQGQFVFSVCVSKSFGDNASPATLLAALDQIEYQG